MMFVEHARKASSWLKSHQQWFKKSVDEPWVVEASNDELVAFLDRQSDQGCGYEDIRDHSVFNFNHRDDIVLFMREVRGQQFRVNVALFGAEYLAASCGIEAMK